MWRGKPVFVRHRTPEEIEAAKSTDVSDLVDPQVNAMGEQAGLPATDANITADGHEKWLVVIGICTHLGCIPQGNKPSESRGDWGGWFCPCHGSHYDTAGRVRKGRRRVIWSCRFLRLRPTRPFSWVKDSDTMKSETPYEPKTGFERWLDDRLPIPRMMHDNFTGFPAPRNLTYMWTFGGILTFRIGRADHDRHRGCDALCAERGDGVRFHRAADARCQLRLAHALHPRGRRIPVLPGGVSAHLPRPLLRLLQSPARNPLDSWRHYPAADDGHGLHGLLAAMGADELLGGDSDHQSVLIARSGYPGSRNDAGSVDMGRLLPSASRRWCACSACTTCFPS